MGTKGKKRNPNLLFINVDEQRYDCLGFTGNPIVKTPNVDNLAKKGISFHQAYTCLPLCSPARATLLCGLIPEVHGNLWCYDDIGHKIPALDNTRNIWVGKIKDIGYQTAYVGKWHVNPDIGPTGFGFDFSPSGKDFPPPKIGKKYFIKEGIDIIGAGEIDGNDIEDTRTHLFAKQCIEFIERFSAGNRPWHIRLDFPEPHHPCRPAEPFASMYNPKDIPSWGSFAETFDNKPYIQKQLLSHWGVENWTWEEWSIYVAGYYGIISQYDDAIGRVIRKLEELNLLENTMIIYTTDHGDACGGHRMMGKIYTMYEDLVHVPLVIRWDGVIEPGRKNYDLISHYLDFGPTVLDLLGLKIPKEYQGISFAPQLMGRENPRIREYITSSCNGQQLGLYTQRMIKDKRYKLVWNLTDIDEFYDLQTDPDELNNLVAEPSCRDLIDDYKIKLYKELDKLNDILVKSPFMKYKFRNKNLKILK